MINGHDIYPMPRPIAVRKVIVGVLVGAMPNDVFGRKVPHLVTALTPHLRPEPVMRPLAPTKVSELLHTRDLQILALIADGRTNGEVGATLKLAEETIKFELRRIMRTLGVHTRAAAVAAAIRRGLIP